MSIEAIKQELAGLDSAHRSKIVAYLLSLDDRQDEAYRNSLVRKIDDKDPANWLTIEEFDRRLSISGDDKVE